jgi:hypothetical protein
MFRRERINHTIFPDTNMNAHMNMQLFARRFVLLLASGIVVMSASARQAWSASVDSACQAAAKSGAQASTIVELYTSEGCDSCPPADKWFSTLRNQAKTGATIVPLAFHVDYWDYIGWKDRFANAQFANRQRASAALHGSRTVYTPQVMIDGRDNRTWQSGSRFETSMRELAGRASRASMSVSSTESGGTFDISADVTVPNDVDRRDAQVYFAITENNLVSRVTSGENKGATLKHDYVVRELLGPFSLNDAGSTASARIQKRVRIGPDWKREDLAVAAFVQHARDGSVLQAIRFPICEK